MRSNYLTFIFLFLITTWAHAQIQNSELSVLGSGGDYKTSETRSLQSSIGESVVSYTESADGRSLQSGFLQNLNSVAIEETDEEAEKKCSIELEPIIAIDDSNGLKWGNLPSNDKYTLTVFHRNGNILHREIYDRSNPFIGGDLKAGNYLYVISNQYDKSCLNSAVTIIK